MEKAKNLVAIPLKSDWTDLGDWNAVWDNMDKDGMELLYLQMLMLLIARIHFYALRVARKK